MRPYQVRVCRLAFGASLLGGCTLVVDAKLDDKPAHASAVDAGGVGNPGGDAANSLGDASSGGTDAGSVPTDSGAPGNDAGPAGGTLTGGALKVSLGQNHGCGLRATGKLACWGSNLENQTQLPTDRLYRDIACGAYHSCAIDQVGALVCVGRNGDGQRVNQPGPYAQVTAGDGHTCVLDAQGKATCWGDNAQGQTAAPTDNFQSLSAGGAFTCGLRNDGSVACWGQTGDMLTAQVSDRRFQSMEAAPGYVCGVTDAQAAYCWSDAAYRVPALGLVRQVAAGAYSGCALLMDQTVRCWYGGGLVESFSKNTGPFATVAVGGTGRCAVPASGAIVCEPSDSSSLVPAPADFP